MSGRLRWLLVSMILVTFLASVVLPVWLGDSSAGLRVGVARGESGVGPSAHDLQGIFGEGVPEAGPGRRPVVGSDETSLVETAVLFVGVLPDECVSARLLVARGAGYVVSGALRTEPGGLLRLDDAPEGAVVEVMDRYYLADIPRVRVRSNELVRVAVKRACDVVGRVLVDDLQACLGVIVNFSGDDWAASTRVGGGGRFRCAGVMPGHVTVSVASPLSDEVLYSAVHSVSGDAEEELLLDLRSIVASVQVSVSWAGLGALSCQVVSRGKILSEVNSMMQYPNVDLSVPAEPFWGFARARNADIVQHCMVDWEAWQLIRYDSLPRVIRVSSPGYEPVQLTIEGGGRFFAQLSSPDVVELQSSLRAPLPAGSWVRAWVSVGAIFTEYLPSSTLPYYDWDGRGALRIPGRGIGSAQPMVALLRETDSGEISGQRMEVRAVDGGGGVWEVIGDW